MGLTKKQLKLNKKLKHQQTKVYAKEQAKKLLNQKDKEWREAIKTEFENKCIICGIVNGQHYINSKGKDTIMRLSAHHLIPREVEKFRHEVLNGVLLCFDHHKYSTEISAHKNSLTFLLWYSTNYKERYDKLINIPIDNGLVSN